MRSWPGADVENRARIEGTIAVYRMGLARLRRRDRDLRLSASLYDGVDVLVPTLFNSGCATVAHGITAIEIEEGEISLA